MKLSLLSVEKDGTIRIANEGPITTDDFADPANPLAAIIGAEWASNRVLLDLDKTDYIDSSAVGWLIDSNKQFRSSGGRLVIHSIHPRVRQILDLLKIGRIMPIADDESAARTLLIGATA